ncbi:MAG: YbaB/EbfC family nucleoid-associated protein [Myxococcota bacterium]
MGPFDGGGLGALFGNFQQKMVEMKERMASTKVSGEAGGGLVKVVLTCDNKVESVSIDPSAMADRELLEDLLRAATGEALRKVREEMEKSVRDLTGGLPLPPGMLPF